MKPQQPKAAPTNNQNSLDEELRMFANTIIRSLKPIIESGYSPATLEETEKLAKIEHQKTLHAINKTIMESVLECLPNKRYEPEEDLQKWRFNTGYNQALAEVRQAVAKKYGRADNEGA